MADILASMSVKLNGDISDFQRAMAAARKELAGFVKLGDQLKSVGQSLLPVSAAIVAFGGYAVKVAGDFESAFNRVEAATQATGQELLDLKAKAQGIALDPKLKFSATDAAGALENLAKNGLTTTQILGGAADASVNLATATGGKLATSADIATDVMNNFNLTAQQLAASVDNITGTTIASKLDIDNYRQALGQAGGVAGQLGVSFTDFNTALAATSSGFSSGSDAGTSFKTFLQRLVPQSKEAEKAMAKLGLKFFDAQGQMKPLREIAGELQKAFKGLSDQQRNELGTQIFGSDSIRTALLLAKQGTEGFDKMAESIGKVNAASQGAILSKGFNGALESAKSALEGFQIALGESGLLDLGTRFLKGAAELLSGLAQADPALLNFGVTIAAAAAALGPLALAIGTFTSTVLPALSVGFTALTGPVGLAIAGIAAGAYLIISNWDDIVAYFTTGSGGRVFGDLASSIVDAGREIAGAVSDIIRVNVELLSFFTGAAAEGGGAKAFAFLIDNITGAISAFAGVIKTTVALLKLDFAGALAGATQIGEGFLKPYREMLGLAKQAPKEGYSGLSAYFAGLNANIGGFTTLSEDAIAAANKLKDALAAPAGPVLTEEQIKALAKLRQQLIDNENASLALGSAYDFMGNKANILKSGVQSLTDVGFAPQGRVVQGFVGQLNSLGEAYDRISTKLSKGIAAPKIEEQKAFEVGFGNLPVALPAIDVTPFTAPLIEATAQMAQFQLAGENFTAGLDAVLRSGLTEVAIGVGEAIGQIMLNAGGIELVGAALLSGIGSLAMDLGKLAIATGIAVSGIKAALESLNPAIAIAGGIALLALGSAVKGAASKIGGGGGGGGLGKIAAPSASAYRAPNPGSSTSPTSNQPTTITHILKVDIRGDQLTAVQKYQTDRLGRVVGFGG